MGLETADVTCCEFTSSGQDAEASSGFDVFRFEPPDTNDSVTRTERIATLPVDGAMVWVRARLLVVSDDATQHAWRFQEGSAARNADGNGERYDLAGTFGYDVVAAAPWANTTLPPVGLNIQLDGDDLVISYSGVAAVTMRWRGIVERIFVGGATP